MPMMGDVLLLREFGLESLALAKHDRTYKTCKTAFHPEELHEPLEVNTSSPCHKRP